MDNRQPTTDIGSMVRRVALAGLSVSVVGLALAVVFVAGRDVGRIDALRAIETAPIVVIGPRAAAARLYPKCQKAVISHQSRAARGQSSVRGRPSGH
jgi:hypothetical protein